ncbi:MAG: shikimate kinase [Pseudonocardiales bacterium]|nr:MAG: shikimate kinase [Pseudonocardiales bacterium]
MTPRVVLVGLPGAGKSTTGRRLAKILKVPFADSDDLVEHSAGRSVRELFAEAGEDEFRRIEATTVASALSQFEGVLALGGGALALISTRQALADSGVPVVLLRASLSTLVVRVGDGRTRPLLAGDPAARLAALAPVRDPLYREVATFTVETEHRTPGRVAAAIAARLHERVSRE